MRDTGTIEARAAPPVVSGQTPLSGRPVLPQLIGDCPYYQATYGGGIDNFYGSIVRCVIANNEVVRDGGGLRYMYGTIANSIVGMNVAGRRGGGADTVESSLFVNSVIVRNTADQGGAVSSLWATAPGSEFRGCTILDNVGTTSHGGVYAARTWLRNCLVHGNHPSPHVWFITGYGNSTVTDSYIGPAPAGPPALPTPATGTCVTTAIYDAPAVLTTVQVEYAGAYEPDTSTLAGLVLLDSAGTRFSIADNTWQDNGGVITLTLSVWGNATATLQATRSFDVVPPPTLATPITGACKYDAQYGSGATEAVVLYDTRVGKSAGSMGGLALVDSQGSVFEILDNGVAQDEQWIALDGDATTYLQTDDRFTVRRAGSCTDSATYDSASHRTTVVADYVGSRVSLHQYAGRGILVSEAGNAYQILDNDYTTITIPGNAASDFQSDSKFTIADYHLDDDDTVCKNGGDDTGFDSGQERDIDQDPRRMDGVVDIGADEL